MTNLFSQFSMHNIATYVMKRKYVIAICCIIAIAIFFRFYNYPNRWGLGSDQARDAIIVRHALLNKQIPLLGPFSASGEFVFGPSWYWIFMVLTSVFPKYILTPWIVQSVLFVGIILVMIRIGKIVGGTQLSLILGIFTAISSAQIEASTNLVQSSLENIISAIVLFYFVSVLNKRTPILHFLLGLSIGVAITTHFQGVPLLIMFPLCIILSKTNIKKIALMLIGFCIPFIPLLIFDIQNNFFETKNVFSYLFLNNDAPQIGQRWLTYAFSFWPMVWGHVVGGFPILGYVGIFGTIIACLYAFKKKTLSRTMVGCLSAFLVIFIFLRYFSGQLFEGFLSFLQPIILLITAWMCTKIIAINKYVGLLLFVSLVIGSTLFSWNLISHATNQTASEASMMQSFIEKAYPNQTYAIYDYQYKNSSISLPLMLFIYAKKENNRTGTVLGVADQLLPNVRVVNEIKAPYHIFIYDLNSYTKEKLAKDNWVLVNPMAVYASVEDWYKDN